MSSSIAGPRLIILANKLKSEVVTALDQLRPWLSQRGEIVAEPDLQQLAGHWPEELPEADLGVVLGGDGTILAQARNLAATGLPLLGVNFGKLGFLAEFSLEDLQRHWDAIVAGRCPVSRRVMIEILAFDADAADCRADFLDMAHCKFQSPAINEAAINNGAPFRMIELELTINPSPGRSCATSFRGDGLVVATPSGSTAYNLSANGPIVSPTAEVLCITPICPHTLSFRPIVIGSSDAVAIRILRANEGTTLSADGQVSVRLATHDQIFIRRHSRSLPLLQNPDVDYWTRLAHRMHWAASPVRD